MVATSPVHEAPTPFEAAQAKARAAAASAGKRDDLPIKFNIPSAEEFGREDDDEKHVCPLQLEVIRRLVRLYSNPGDVVLDPFMGIGSTAWVAIEQGRDAVGFELKESYHQLAVRNCELALTRRQQAQTLPLFAGMTAD